MENKKLYDIKFLKQYFKYNNVNIKLISQMIGIDSSALYKSLNNGRKINKNNLNKILKFFGCENYKELKEKVEHEMKNNIKLSPFLSEKNIKQYDLSFLKDYLEYSKISLRCFSRMTNISAYTLNNYINGEYCYSKVIVNKIFEYFNVKTFDEIHEKIEELKQNKCKELPNNKAIYNMSFLKEYILKFNMQLSDISIHLDINKTLFSKYINGKRLVTNDTLQKFLDLFDSKSYDDLKNKIKYSIENNKQIILNEKKHTQPKEYDISFLKEYLTLFKIRKSVFSKQTNISIYKLNNYLNGSIEEDELKKILIHFDVKNYSELKNKIEKSIKNIKTKNEPRKYDISFLKPYLNYKNITQKEMAQKLDVDPSNFNSYLNSRILANRIFINKVIDYFGEDTYQSLKDNTSIEINKKEDNIVDYAIISLIFDKESNILNRIDKLSKILEVEKEELIIKYKFYLNIYKECLEKNRNNELDKKIRELK